MPDRSAWLMLAFERYHAGQISFPELARIVADHRNRPVPRETGSADR